MDAFNDDDGEEWESDEEINLKGLLNDQIFNSVESLCLHHQENYGFDLKLFLKLEEEQNIMLVNYIRKMIVNLDGLPIKENNITDLITQLKRGDHVNEIYMKPTLEDDQLLFLINDYIFGIEGGFDDDEDEVKEKYDAPSQVPTAQNISYELSTEEMRAQIEKMNAIIKDLNTSDDKVSDDYYFDGYSSLTIHETMLRDTARTSAYSRALSPENVSGKIVLDVGCGTGILSMFAARAGARKVVGVECGGIAARAKNIIAHNGYSGTVDIVQGRLEELDLPELRGQVDVIVSEWMGYGLYFENMLSSVLFAKQKYLSKNGILIPSSCSLFIEAVTSHQAQDDRLLFWKDVYGFQMTEVTDMFLEEAQVQLLSSEDSCSPRSLLHRLEVKHAEDDDLDFHNEFELVISKDTTIHAFALTFDVDLCPGLTLSTAADAEPTHWKHTALWLSESHRRPLKVGDTIRGTVKYERREDNKRDYTISAHWRYSACPGESFRQVFALHA